MASSISFNLGEGNLAHNTRDYIAKNVDQERSKDNICYTHKTLEKAYEEIFKSAIEEYDSKQKRSDRKIGSVKGYMDKIKASGNGEKLFYEIVVQVGDKTNALVGSEGGETAKKILDEYAKNFEKRNPNLKVFSMHLHMDETTPHLHIDFIPVADGYTKGLKKRNSMTKALDGQGITSGNKHKDNHFIVWEKQERAEIKRLCATFDIKVSQEQKARGTLSVTDYKVAKDTVKEEIQESYRTYDQTAKAKKRIEKKYLGLFGSRETDELIVPVERWNAFVSEIAARKEAVEVAEKRIGELERKEQATHELFLQTQRKEQQLKEQERKQTQQKKELEEKEKRCNKVLSLNLSDFWKEKFAAAIEAWKKGFSKLNDTIKELRGKNEEQANTIARKNEKINKISNSLDLFAMDAYNQDIEQGLHQIGLGGRGVDYCDWFDGQTDKNIRGQVLLANSKHNHTGYVVIYDEENQKIHARMGVPQELIETLQDKVYRDKQLGKPTTVAELGHKRSATPLKFMDYEEYVKILKRTRTKSR